ncbi:TetR/AcrR family transcriptional regulator [Compostimonas suwonensis]|uniref:AcrR family transcriptional regulator n=1 Tax=Compostimonas suwonensis TaxID=1048394 RepID=A0A2M9BTY9_9MICO|nr:TetR/AcrR family transcriptional regulator [Compostimonas suwonensis]PJJ61391.1 AcrR family transcriptional regulator [Compostimonas suwonensis]
MTTPNTRTRTTYRHGDLRGALLAAGVDMAAEGGPDAVVLREATRRAGVAPNAAYRHFADRRELLHAVSAAAQGHAADRIERELNTIPPHDDPAEAARLRLRAVGSGYIAFAREEPGLFRTAFSVPDDLSNAGDPSKAGAGGRSPFQLVGMVLDELVEVGSLPVSRRGNAEFLAWSAVHGLGMLVIDGPLRGLTDEMVDGATSRLLDMVERGL